MTHHYQENENRNGYRSLSESVERARRLERLNTMLTEILNEAKVGHNVERMEDRLMQLRERLLKR